MPTYSYACADCGDKFDIVQSFTDDALTVCQKWLGQAAQAVQLGGHRVQGQRLLSHRQPLGQRGRRHQE